MREVFADYHKLLQRPTLRGMQDYHPDVTKSRGAAYGKSQVQDRADSFLLFPIHPWDRRAAKSKISNYTIVARIARAAAISD
jgi:hypothetical protein